MSPAPEPSRPSAAKIHRFRSTEGCLTYRRRKKKCDETKPNCVACTRNKLECFWPVEKRRRAPNPGGIQKIFQNPRNASQPSILSKSVIETADDTLEWSSLTSSFISPLRASSLTDVSNTLFAHYMAETASMLSTLPAGTNNPFLTMIVPLAYSDDLVMHALLAVSGTHLVFRDPGTEVFKAMCHHYSVAIKTLRGAICNFSVRDVSQVVRLLLVLMILSFLEAISGNDQEGMFYHLRAARHLILTLIESPLCTPTDENGRLFGFVLEIYCFLALANNITPFGAIGSRTLPHDLFLHSLGKMSCFNTFGAIFGGSHGLFELLPLISMLSTRRVTEDDSSPSLESLQIHHNLCIKITEWRPPQVPSSDRAWQMQRASAMEVWRNAVLIYLETAMFHHTLGEATTRGRIRSYIDAVISNMEQVSGSPFETIFLWPIMVTGSCMMREDQRELLRTGLRSSRFHMKHCLQGALLLELVWKEPNERIFGPFGLSVMMQKHGINFGIA
ncbi:hypothetical protein FE257_008241 [Aspergillus nanangensis]|uniref:Zn(2)-C6 fungal-type domain-containing protein n=1 Tax=Aspergillus nanangensis TaxID=2582783 RepID=A0AAD4CNM1_ASPNN|nr:hypothetical protein FE257_008241 [Aspergillus nanangensis]